MNNRRQEQHDVANPQPISTAELNAINNRDWIEVISIVRKNGKPTKSSTKRMKYGKDHTSRTKRRLKQIASWNRKVTDRAKDHVARTKEELYKRRHREFLFINKNNTNDNWYSLY